MGRLPCRVTGRAACSGKEEWALVELPPTPFSDSARRRRSAASSTTATVAVFATSRVVWTFPAGGLAVFLAGANGVSLTAAFDGRRVSFVLLLLLLFSAVEVWRPREDGVRGRACDAGVPALAAAADGDDDDEG